jgi:putative PIN family toxin of toxin-antitoxin system
MGTLEVIRVVLDTNVLVSGLLFGGTPGKLLDLWKTGTIRLIMSRVMLDEFLRVLAYPKLRLSEEEIHYLLYVEVLPHAEIAKVHPGPILIPTDPSDDMFLRCAVAAGAKHIISGDRHLLQLKSYKRIKILSPAEFLYSVIF